MVVVRKSVSPMSDGNTGYVQSSCDSVNTERRHRCGQCGGSETGRYGTTSARIQTTVGAVEAITTIV